ncbi:MAG: hypothetical protein ABMB14_17700 [Myxococcota bacterium]
MAFAPRGRAPERAAVEAWLASRPNWRVGADRASYYAPSTGVYFGCGWLDQVGAGPALVFELDVERSDVFGREAEAEVRALSAAFDLAADGFLASWRAANAIACRSAVDRPRRTLPAATNLAVWRWNAARDPYLDRLATIEMVPCVPPPVRLVAPPADATTVLTSVQWTGCTPIVLPEVDVVVVADERATRAIPMVALRPWLEGFPHRPAGHAFGRSGVVYDAGLPHWLIDFDVAPDALADAVRTLGTPRRLVAVLADDVLDRESVARHHESGSGPRPVEPTSTGWPSEASYR